MDEALDAPGQPEPASRKRDSGGRYAHEPDTAIRDAKATALRRNGKSYPQIAAELGIPVSTAFDAVQRCLTAVRAEPGEQLRAMELERLDAGLVRLNDLEQRVQEVMDTDPTETLHAADRLIKIEDERRKNSQDRRKLLGLDAAEKVEVSGGVVYEIVGIDPAGLV